MSSSSLIPELRIYRQDTFAFTVGYYTAPRLQELIEEPAHRHDLHEIFLVTQGSSQQRIDDNPYYFQQNTLGLIAKGQIHDILDMKDFKIWAVFFDNSVLSDKLHTLCLSLFNFQSKNQFQLQAEERQHIESTFKAMKFIQGDKSSNHLSIDLLQAYLGTLLWHIERLKRKDYQYYQGKLEYYEPCQEFLSLLERCYSSERSVRFYAGSLKLSSRQLSDLTYVALGKRAKDLIEERICLEAKRLLHYSDLSIQAIGYSLGFEDPAYFARFFKRSAKLSPTKFRSAFRTS